jgi:hypothetical protein
MIPAFPEFRPITIEDGETIENYTHKYAPYSDFNFYSLFAWDTDNKRQVSVHNGNLVVLITEYNTAEPLLSFLGTNRASDTALDLIQYAIANNISPILRYVPEVSVETIDNPNLEVKEDRGDFDYIYSTEELSILKGKKYKNKRQLYNWFKNDNPDVVFIQKDIIDPTNNSDIHAVLKAWENKKQTEEKECDLEHERIAIERLLKAKNSGVLTVSSLWIEDTVIAFSIEEIMPGGFAISHFCKADNSFRGVYDYLNVLITKKLLENGVTSWNWEQDLGLEGLREAKMKYRPVTFLKKFHIELKT